MDSIDWGDEFFMVLTMRRLTILLMLCLMIPVALADYSTENYLSWLASSPLGYEVYHNFSVMSEQTRGTNDITNGNCFDVSGGNIVLKTGGACAGSETYKGFYPYANYTTGIFSVGMLVNITANSSMYVRLHDADFNFSQDQGIICQVQSDAYNNVQYSHGSSSYNLTTNNRLENNFLVVESNMDTDKCSYYILNGTTGVVLYSSVGNNTFNTGTNKPKIMLGVNGNVNKYGDELRAISGSFTNFSDHFVNFTLYDEDTLTLLNQSATIVLTLLNNASQYTITAVNGTGGILIPATGTYSVRITSTSPISYNSRYFNAELDFDNNINITSYLNSNNDMILYYKDADSNTPIEGVSVSLYSSIDNDFVLLEQRSTDVTGAVQFSYLTDVLYIINSTKTGYDNKTFILDPVIQNEYTVRLDKSLGVSDVNDVYVNFYPTSIVKGQAVTFNWLMESSSGVLSSYGFNLSYPCGNVGHYGTNAYGASVGSYINVTCGTYNEHINLTYFYTLNNGLFRNFTYQYALIAPLRFNNTIYSNKDNTYGLGSFDRYIIVTIIALVIAGIGSAIGGMIIGLILGLFIMVYFAWAGFISGYVLILPLLVAFFYIAGRRI